MSDHLAKLEEIERTETQLLRASQVAERLQITPRQVYRLMKSGEIPVVKWGGIVRIREVDLEWFIHQHLNNTGNI